jgi:DNA recombination protein RmuC
METAWIVVASVAAFAAGAVVAHLTRRLLLVSGERDRARGELVAAQARLAQADADGASTRQRRDVLQEEVTKLVETRARLETDLAAEKRAAVERATEAERSRELVRAELLGLAARILDEKGKVMLDRSREGLEALLAPLGQKLKDFEAKVEKTYDQENRDRASLLGSLAKLQETQAKLHADAESLARALTGDSKVQGDWGELILERLLEIAGLTEGHEYDLQLSHLDEDGGRKRPDAVVYFPGNRAVVVDAKCSLTAFVESMRADAEGEREAALDRHVASVRAHVKELASKRYQDVLAERTLDIVYLFVPNEAAFHAAIARDAALVEDAFRQRVLVCSPTTLLATLQVVSHLWRTEKQNHNAQKIAEEAGKLLEKLAAFVGDLDEVGLRLGRAQESWSAARAKLVTGRGNVLRKARDIATLGAPVKTDRVQALLAGGGEEDEPAAPPPLALPEAKRRETPEA